MKIKKFNAFWLLGYGKYGHRPVRKVTPESGLSGARCPKSLRRLPSPRETAPDSTPSTSRVISGLESGAGRASASGREGGHRGHYKAG